MAHPRSHILLVEDDPTQQLILSRLLEPHYTVQSHNTVKAAARSLRNPYFTPDLILCDMHLPDGSGMDLRRTIISHNTLSSCPFIFLSGSSDDKIRSDAAVLGIDDFLSKPIKPDTLLTAVERVLTRARQLRAAHAQRLDQQITDPLQPAVPDRIGPYDLQLRYSEMAAGGGDFVFHMPGHDCDYILFGDVVGHGVPAKFFLHAYAGYIYGLTRSLRHQKKEAHAGALMSLLNDEVTMDAFLKRWLFTCIILCIGHDGRMTLANGGHPAAWVTGAHSITPLSERGPMPGLVPQIAYGHNVIQLRPGERLYIASDGANLTKSMLENLRQFPAEYAANHVITQSADTEHPDDATILVVSAKNPS